MPVTLLSFIVAPISASSPSASACAGSSRGGLALVGAGLLLMSGLEAGDDWTALLAGFLVAGGGIGMVNPALATAAVGVVEPRRAGMASGINSTFRQVGIATGIAAWGAIFQHVVRHEFVRLRPAPASAAAGRARRATWPTSSPSAARAARATRSSRGSGSRRSSTASTTCCCSPALLAFVGALRRARC